MKSIATLVVSLAVASLTFAAPPEGSWKFRLPVGEKPISFLIALSQSEGKWVGDFIDSRPGLKTEPKFSSVVVKGDVVQFTITVGGREVMNFDGVVSKDGKKLTGSFNQNGSTPTLIELAPTKLKKFEDPYDVNRETFDQIEGTPTELFDIGFEILPNLGTRKVPAEEVRGLVERLAKGAATYGGRWDRATAIKIASILVDQPTYADIALAQARRAERLLGENDPISEQMDVIDILSRCLVAAKKADEAKPYATKLARLEARDVSEYAKTMPFGEVAKYKGRQAKSSKIVVVEGIAGSEFNLSGPIEQTLDALSKAYEPTDVLVLNYHYHLPEPSQGDPLTAPETSERLAPLVEQIQRGQFLFISGKPGPRITNPSGAKEFFEQTRTEIDKKLETMEKTQLTLAATKNAKGFDVKANVKDLDVGSNKMALRFAVIEPRVRYAGGNGVRYHVNVVRSLPGGGKGFALTKKEEEQKVAIDANEIRTNAMKYLTEFASNDGEFPRNARPFDLKNLKLVAFIQNDSTGDILTAAIVNLE